MTGSSLSSIHIDKLGHNIEEIRVRALHNVISKWNLGFIQTDDFTIRKELFSKLIDWFTFDTCPEKEKALSLILRLLKTQDGTRLALEIGSSTILSVLAHVEGESNVNILIEQIKSFIIHSKAQAEEMLSEMSSEPDNYHIAEEHSRLSVSREMIHKGEKDMKKDLEVSSTVLENCFHHFVLPWQPLVVTDRHVFSAVENSLVNSDDKDVILHSCNFFVDVMIQDFPAEVFLQRPTIVKVFLNLLNIHMPGSNKKLCSSVVKCLHRLTIGLLERVQYYTDPSVANLKQENCTSRSQTPSCLSYVSSRTIEAEDYVAGNKRGVKYLERSAESDSSSSATEASTEKLLKSNLHLGSNEDSVLLQFHQMHLPLYCTLTLYQAISHRAIHLTIDLIKLTKMCISRNIWMYKDPPVLEVIENATHILELLGDAIEQHIQAPQTEDDARLTFLQTLTVTRGFLVNIVPCELADSIIPRKLKCALVKTLLDYPLMCLHPELHTDILNYCETFKDPHAEPHLQLYFDCLCICSSMTSTVKFLKTYDRLDGRSILELAFEALPSLSFHKTLSFVRIILEICINKMCRWTLDAEAEKLSGKIVLRLLTHPEPDIQLEMYMCCHQNVVAALGVDHVHSKMGPAHISFLFDVDILAEIISFGMTSKNAKIIKYSSDMLIHFVKGKMLMTDKLWQKFVETVIPVMPLLQCHADKSTALGRAVTAMLDINPDTGNCELISKIEVAKGNIRALFCPHELVRSEAVTRLLRLLMHEEGSQQMLPELKNLHSTVVEHLGFIDTQSFFTKYKKQGFYEVGSLCHVMDVLKSEGVDPRIRRSALNQLAAMLEDPQLHLTFLEQNGIGICLEIFKSALMQKDIRNQPDSAIPIISILKKICLHSSKVRCRLAQDPLACTYILRAFFMFIIDASFRQDVSQLLCMLLYSDFILAVPEGEQENGNILWCPLSMPELIVKNMRLPFRTQIHWRTSPHTQASLRAVLLANEKSHTFLRLCWTSEWFGGVKHVLSWHGMKLTEQPDFSADLKAQASDLECLKATSLNHCTKQCLYTIQNGTTHKAVEIGVKKMLGYITLQGLLNEHNEAELVCGWKTIPWEATLMRFFSSPPACPEDEELLVALLQFLSVCMKNLSPTDIRKPQWTWVYRMLKDPTQALPSMLKMDSGLRSKVVCQEILFLCQDCCLLEHQLEEEENGKNKADIISWVYIVHIICHNLKSSDTQHFYNLGRMTEELTAKRLMWATTLYPTPAPIPPAMKLRMLGIADKSCNNGRGQFSPGVEMDLSKATVAVACSMERAALCAGCAAFLDWMLTCLSHVTGCLGWSRGCTTATPLIADLICYLAEIIAAFHGSKDCHNDYVTASFMGLTITRNSIICMNHVLCELQSAGGNKGWEVAWFSALKRISVDEDAGLRWLPLLWLSREPVIRAAALQLVAGLCSTQTASMMLVQALEKSVSSIWDVSLEFLLDHEEASMVREQAALIITNLCSHNMSTNTPAALGLGNGMPSETSQTSGSEVLLYVLDNVNFYIEVASMVSCLYLGDCYTPSNRMDRWTVETLSGTSLHPNDELQRDHFVLVYNREVGEHTSGVGSDDHESKDSYCITTPNLIKACCWFMNNLLTVAPEETMKNIKKVGLTRLLFRSICSLPEELKTKRQFVMYAELLEMYSAVCTVLAKCVCMDCECFTVMLNKSDGLVQLLGLLNPSLYNTKRTNLVHLRNRLWSRIFRLLSCIVTVTKGYQTVMDILSQGDPGAFMTALQTSINGKSCVDLRNSALSSLTSLLCLESRSKGPSTLTSPNENCEHNLLTLQNVLDTDGIDDNVDFIENGISDYEKPKRGSGSVLCSLLLNLYDVHSTRYSSGDSKGPSLFTKSTVLNALSSLLAVSLQAKKFALNGGLLENLLFQLKELHVRLSVESIENIKKYSEKRKVNPVLQEVSLIFALLTNFLYGSPEVKVAAAGVGLADMMHKLWAWCCVLPSLLIDALKLLCTYTAESLPACQSLVFTTPLIGVSLRRMPSSHSLLHEVLNFVSHEIEVITKGYDMTALSLAFYLIKNGSHTQECRVVIFKSSIFQNLSKLHTLSMKKLKQWEELEFLWLQLLMDCTCYPEGQLSFPKVQDAIEIMIDLCESARPTIRLQTFGILRNITFNHLNRPRLLASSQYLQLLNIKLTECTPDEQNLAIEMVWALIANNQKAKMVLKSSGIAGKLSEVHAQYKVTDEDQKSKIHFEIVNYIMKIVNGIQETKKN